MSKHNAAPTLGWVVASNVWRTIAIVLLVIVALLAIQIYAIRYTVERNCEQYYDQHFVLFGYWINLEVGSTELTCPVVL